MTHVVGVDGGGTGTRAIVVDGSGAQRGRGEGPPGLVGRVRTGEEVGAGRRASPNRPEGVAAAVETAVSAAVADAGVFLPVEYLCVGLAGAGSPDARAAVRRALEDRRLARGITVTTDVDVAFRDAFPEDTPGILLVCGTGSVALGRDGAGRRVRAGGWGALLDDAGSGYWIGLRALGSALRAHDGREPGTRLTDLAVSFLGVTGPEDLVSAADRAPKDRIASLAPEVIRIADEGDEAARRIVDGAVGELVTLARAVAERLHPAESRPPSVSAVSPVVLHGGLVAPGRPLRPFLRQALEAEGISVLERRVTPALGAATMARETLGRGEV